jgi:hypothetical protein
MCRWESMWKRQIGLAEREIHVPVYAYNVFSKTFRTGLADSPRIAAVGTSFSPLPCKARHGYMVTSVHRVEVEVGAGGPASALLSGGRRRCAAGGRPHIALRCVDRCT